MTFTILTLALAFTAATAQTPPAAPVRPAEPVMPGMPGMPAMPAMPVLPEMPDLQDLVDLHDLPLLHDLPDFRDLPALADVPQADIDRAMMQAEAAIARAGSMLPGLDRARVELAVAADAFGAAGWENQARAMSRDRESAAYERGRAALDRRNWEDAVVRFGQVVDMKGDRADAALYWKAYALSRAGRSGEAQAAIGTLRSSYPKSRYLNDANALDVELKRGGGQPVSPESQQDEDLKLLAIQGLQHSDPEQAIPLLEKILVSSNGPRVKERALYVLALSNSARAREILLGIAKGAGNPDLQRKAIDYLATHSRRDGRSALEEVYQANTDQDVRMRVLRAYMTSGDKPRLLNAARTEPNPELRMAAIRYLGSSGGAAELAELYERETNAEIRLQIVRSLGATGAVDRLQQIARTEKDPKVRQQVIRAFGAAGRERTGTVLRDMYAGETTPEGRRAIMQAMHSQGDAEGLVAIARRETDPKMKEDIVRRLSTMTKSKVALEYLMELLNK